MKTITAFAFVCALGASLPTARAADTLDISNQRQVFVDPTAPADQKFRLITRQSDPGTFVDLFSSPDGIHWKLTHKDILKYHPPGKPHHLDSQNVIFWDDRLDKYVAYMRRNIPTDASQGRTIARTESRTELLRNVGRILLKRRAFCRTLELECRVVHRLVV